MHRSILFGLLLFLAGCVKEADWTPPDTAPDLLVVEGMITDQQGAHYVTLSQAIPTLNENPLPVSEATVLLSSEDSAWTMIEIPEEAGRYATPEGFTGITGKTYTLQVFYQGKVFSARDILVPGSYFSELRYARNDDDDLYHIDYVASAFNNEKPAMWEIELDWSKVDGYEQTDPALCRARLLFYSLPTLDVSEIFAPLVEQISFPLGTVITERRYSLSETHAEYIRQMLLETNWQGGLFPSANANVASNLSTGATGFFAASAVTTLSLTVK